MSLKVPWTEDKGSKGVEEEGCWPFFTHADVYPVLLQNDPTHIKAQAHLPVTSLTCVPLTSWVHYEVIYLFLPFSLLSLNACVP